MECAVARRPSFWKLTPVSKRWWAMEKAEVAAVGVMVGDGEAVHSIIKFERGSDRRK